MIAQIFYKRFNSKNDKNHCARHHKCLHYKKAVMYILQFNFPGGDKFCPLFLHYTFYTISN